MLLVAIITTLVANTGGCGETPTPDNQVTYQQQEDKPEVKEEITPEVTQPEDTAIELSEEAKQEMINIAKDTVCYVIAKDDTVLSSLMINDSIQARTTAFNTMKVYDDMLKVAIDLVSFDTELSTAITEFKGVHLTTMYHATTDPISDVIIEYTNNTVVYCDQFNYSNFNLAEFESNLRN